MFTLMRVLILSKFLSRDVKAVNLTLNTEIKIDYIPT